MYTASVDGIFGKRPLDYIPDKKGDFDLSLYEGENYAKLIQKNSRD